ncbi:ribosomal L7Ae/L30e/S12e/Gadd45 family protein [Alkaliphilus peptidifermentans]|uniref:Large subunit ribosomal protein L7A n=1 Tax=Alkaliphilus peptidifermentans DSM 18978 TaxID=1120976 RepID=A0A1G5LA43_9FIRM|nr:ribosomal L7Ae/L30e/S12e/Gadd45 family protein [Alkaliphilus peptidifermentans]SCZ09676.1 large subunit ribosomal protein L7A [Alkaliphilus peptidifermentans DSM 18978]
MLEILQHEKKTIGIKQTAKALKQDKAKALYVADDADQHLLQPLVELAEAKGIEVIHVDSMKKLGKACKIDVGAATAAVLK